MLSQTHYLLRSRQDGQYLVARPRLEKTGEPAGGAGFLLIFIEDSDALSYVNTHGSGVANRFAVEAIAGPQLRDLIKRWDFLGVGVVEDPLLPRVTFLKASNNLFERGF